MRLLCIAFRSDGLCKGRLFDNPGQRIDSALLGRPSARHRKSGLSPVQEPFLRTLSARVTLPGEVEAVRVFDTAEAAMMFLPEGMPLPRPLRAPTARLAGEGSRKPELHRSEQRANITTMKRVALALVVMALGSSAFAAGIDSRAFSCFQLQGAIAAYRFVFINNPNFDDFAVADQSQCSFSDIVIRRTVPTTDNPECIVNYCRRPPDAVNRQ